MTMQQESIDPRLRDALAATADDDRTRGASAVIEQQLRAAVRAQRAARDRRRQIVWLAAAAAIVIAVTTVRWRMTVPDGDAGLASRGPAYGQGPADAQGPAYGQQSPPAPPNSAAADAVPAQFIPLRYAGVPTRNGQIVQIVVPASALASFGLEPANATASAVSAEVFVGEDGLARAVRFNPLSTRELPQ
jgi:hypothetical protein